MSAYQELDGGAATTALTPKGIIAYVGAYAEATSGADISGLTPENVTALVNAYKELDAGADISTLKPDEITAYIQNYLEKEGVDTTSLKPEGITAFVLAYEEMSGGALTTALKPENIVAITSHSFELDRHDAGLSTDTQVSQQVSRTNHSVQACNYPVGKVVGVIGSHRVICSLLLMPFADFLQAKQKSARARTKKSEADETISRYGLYRP